MTKVSIFSLDSLTLPPPTPAPTPPFALSFHLSALPPLEARDVLPDDDGPQPRLCKNAPPSPPARMYAITANTPHWTRVHILYDGEDDDDPLGPEDVEVVMVRYGTTAEMTIIMMMMIKIPLQLSLFFSFLFFSNKQKSTQVTRPSRRRNVNDSLTREGRDHHGRRPCMRARVRCRSHLFCSMYLHMYMVRR